MRRGGKIDSLYMKYNYSKKREIMSYQEKAEKLFKEHKELQKKYEILLKAVQFWEEESADEDWCHRYVLTDDEYLIDVITGKTARKALKEIKDGKEN
jgi:hypothetical protein